ncbi:Adenylate kinase [Gossypium arboreum]|uniref:Adenylate kinase n=1 Tax=Gossypium arboreum TaxID=29729 RepID=A0A0B0PMI1_GOSAR|nr:Adenylate kinase [Gossypium arboreum]
MLHFQFHTYFTETEFFIFRNLVRYKRTCIGYTFHILIFCMLSSDGLETIQMFISKYNANVPDVVLHVIQYRCLCPKQGLTRNQIRCQCLRHYLICKSQSRPVPQTRSYTMSQTDVNFSLKTYNALQILSYYQNLFKIHLSGSQGHPIQIIFYMYRIYFN